MPTRVHMAGRVLGQIQYCAQCGGVLVDQRGVQVPLGSTGGRYFAVGEHVESSQAGRCLSLTDDPVDCHR